MTRTLLLICVFFIACNQYTPPPPSTPLPAATALVPTYRTPTPLGTAYSPTPTSVSSISQEHLQAFGRNFWSGVEYTCVTRGSTGACITFDSEYSTYIFFVINKATKEGASYFVTPNREDVFLVLRNETPAPPHDFIELCTYSDYEHWHLTAYSDCNETTLPGGEGVAALSIVLEEKWPKLLDEIR